MKRIFLIVLFSVSLHAADIQVYFSPKGGCTEAVVDNFKCEGFRCMAVADYDGKWRDFSTGKQLTSIVLSFWQ